MELDRAKGTRDFSPKEQLLRNRMISTIRSVFEKYGFAPIETPVMERYDVMTAKFAAGEGSDCCNEIFKLSDQGGRSLGLRYEFTFALARYVAMNPKMKLPFKRYQIGPNFRDGPIKAGRYRELYQCDIDTVGSSSLLADAEVMACLSEVYRTFGLKPVLKVSSRKFLTEILTYFAIPESEQFTVIVSIDKLDKIGVKGVKEELKTKGIDEKVSDSILKALSTAGSTQQKIATFKKLIPDGKSLVELEEVFTWLSTMGVPAEFSPSLARGFGYYTGPIFEVYIDDPEITCSIGAGGRWDNMIGQYVGNPEMNYPATGGSVGLEPLFDILLRKEKELPSTATKVYIVPMGTEKESLAIVSQLRAAGIPTALDLAGRKLKQNLEYAAAYEIPYVGIIGSNELEQKKIMFRDMKSGKQELLTVDQIAERLK